MGGGEITEVINQFIFYIYFGYITNYFGFLFLCFIVLLRILL